MPKQITQLITGEIYHIVSRAVGESIVFKDKNDYYRGIYSIYEFNNSDPVQIWRRRRDRIAEKKVEKSVVCPTYNTPDKRNKIVEILVFCFMDNHIHLLLRQLKDDGIRDFIRKVGGGYANYFNKKYNRKGHLFNQFRAIHIKTDEQLMNVFVYIHANPISIIEPGWKEKGIINANDVMSFLNNYKWSSFQDYTEKINFVSVTNRELLLNLMGGSERCKQSLEDKVFLRKVWDVGDTTL